MIARTGLAVNSFSASILIWILMTACSAAEDGLASFTPTPTAAPAPTAVVTPSPTPDAFPPQPSPAPTAAGGPGASSTRLVGVNDFLYQLQDINLSEIGSSAYDLVVMDYSAEGDEESEFSRGEIERLRDSPGGSKIVLAYMSIGEAEDYRFYWQSRWREGDPSWIDGENPDWQGNYKVRYWEPEWQDIVLEYTTRIAEAGFDGVYLDIIDAYEYFLDDGRDSAPQEMADFVALVAERGREINAGFLVFPQNGAELARLVPEYLDTVDGIGQEDIYYGYDDDDRATPAEVTRDIESYLDLFRDEGKLVLTVDYANSRSNVDDAYRRSRNKGYVPFVTVRDLDRMTMNAGHAPD
jgi:cysteinyl-tRNA synthetase